MGKYRRLRMRFQLLCSATNAGCIIDFSVEGNCSFFFYSPQQPHFSISWSSLPRCRWKTLKARSRCFRLIVCENGSEYAFASARLLIAEDHMETSSGIVFPGRRCSILSLLVKAYI